MLPRKGKLYCKARAKSDLTSVGPALACLLVPEKQVAPVVIESRWMNTKQLIALWLGGLGVASLLAIRLGTAGQAGALVVVTAMFVYSLGSHPRASNRKVILAVGVAVACGLGASYVYLTLRNRAAARKREQADSAAKRLRVLDLRYPIDPEAVKVFDVRYNRLFPGQVQGRIQNNSGRPVTYLTLHVAFRDGRKVLDEGDCTGEPGSVPDFYPVPPGETRSFEAACPEFDVPWSGHVFLDFRVRSVMTSER
jgi:hypothetical protein